MRLATGPSPGHHGRVNHSGILDDLAARGLISDTSDRESLGARLAEGPIQLYCGFDPTADSLHVGNLVPLATLRRFQLFGHKPIVLAGGATGMIGDPSGRSSERNLLDDDALARNLELVTPQLRRFLDFDGESAARLFDNRAWTVHQSMLDFMRDVGKHVTINTMIGKESVKNRLASSDGISYTEFSYMLLQAHDFLWLYENEGCEMQIGGSDQWGNISLGIDLIRRRTASHAHGLTVPLLTRSDGTKYGKTAGGDQIWLGDHRMSPYRFYQSWIQAPDEDIEKLLLRLTFLDLGEIASVVADHGADPGQRLGQRTLARELSNLVHGEAATAAAEQASAILFGQPVDDITAEALDTIAGEVPSAVIDRDSLGQGMDLVDLLVTAELATSKGDARRAIEQNSISVNGKRHDGDVTIGTATLLHDRHLLLRRGRKRYVVVAAE
ncbi:MAG: tyrosine--tRNA ligase [Actinomycetia bacterium]|nr:tyrosine--tRNA ligase [Actinomycetes bacterium]